MSQPPSEVASPGWDAITAALKSLYGDREPQHFGVPVPYEQGGPDPLRRVSAYYNPEPTPHWHFVTYGFTELFGKEMESPATSGYGFELTFRLACGSGEKAPPMWPVQLLQYLARYVFKTGNAFAAGDHINLLGALTREPCTELSALAFLRDPRLAPSRSVNGDFEFLQAVGITLDEEDLIKDWNTQGLLEMLSEGNPLLLTPTDRRSVLLDPRLSERVRSRVESEGSSMGICFVPEARWICDAGDAVTLVLEPLVVRDLGRLLRGRTLHGRSFLLVGGPGQARQQVEFVFAEQASVAPGEERLTVSLTGALARELLGTLKPEVGTYHWPGLERFTIQVTRP